MKLGAMDMEEQPALLCGLLCRFMGTRFVASTKHGMICQVGAHGNASSINLRLDFMKNNIRFVVTINPEDGSPLVTQFSCPFRDIHASVCDDRVDQSVVFSAAVARWVCPRLMRTTFIQIPRSGLRGCVSATAITIGAAAMSFCGKSGALYHHNTHTATVKGIRVVFWPRHISVNTEMTQEVVYIPDSVATQKTICNGKPCYVYVERETNTPNNLDEVIVQTCRVMQISLTRP